MAPRQPVEECLSHRGIGGQSAVGGPPPPVHLKGDTMHIFGIDKRTRTIKLATAAAVTATALTAGGVAVSANPAQAAVRSCSAGTPTTQRPVLKYRDVGSCVTELQRRLISHGISVPGGADGSFGPGTVTAVKRFQQVRRLHVDGIVGQVTWSTLVGTASSGAGATYRTTRCGNNGNKVLLVFDDASPSMRSYRNLVATAKANNIGIGVAPNGNAVRAGRADPAYARANGMLVVDHTYDHKDLTRLSSSQIQWEITQPYVRSNYVRPPYGAYNARVSSLLARNGKYNCMWNLDPRDWDGKSAWSAANYIVRNASAGSTVVVHLNHMGATASTLPYIKKGLANRGLTMCAPWSGPTREHMPPTYC